MRIRGSFPIHGLLLLLLGSNGLTGTLRAADLTGSVRLGTQSSGVEFKNPRTGEESNDSQSIFFRLRSNVENLNDDADMIVLDVRDHYDAFAVLDQDFLELTPNNELQVRQLAYKRPYERNNFYFTLGRFSLSEANVLVNDGVEAGLRVSKRFRVGAFGGVAPKDIVDAAHYEEINPTLTYEGLQVGAYTTFERPNVHDYPNIYFTQAVVSGPSFDVPTYASRVYYFNQAVINTSEKNRFASHVVYDLDPKALLRRLNLSHFYFGRSVRVHTMVGRVNTSDYQMLRSMRDTLPPSGFDSASLRPTIKLGKTFSLQAMGLFERRLADSKTKTEFAGGPLFTGLSKGTASFGVIAGVRNNFISKDSYFRINYQVFRSVFDLNASYYQATETYETGEVLHPKIASLDIGYAATEKIRGTFGGSIQQDENVTVKSVLATIGYVLGRGQVSPRRSKTPEFEEL